LYLDMTSNQVLSDVKGRLVYYLDMTTNQVQMLVEPSVLSRYDH
jgi:hypothetical protein